jgi:hypothetical protein
MQRVKQAAELSSMAWSVRRNAVATCAPPSFSCCHAAQGADVAQLALGGRAEGSRSANPSRFLIHDVAAFVLLDARWLISSLKSIRSKAITRACPIMQLITHCLLLVLLQNRSRASARATPAARGTMIGAYSP